MEAPTLAQLAEQLGFEHFGPVNMAALVPLPQVRAMCAADRCAAYGHSWSCPPACGELEAIGRRMRQYHTGLLVQTVGAMEDEFDLAAIAAVEKNHKARFDALARQAGQLWPGCMPMAAGTCRRCRKCTYPNAPCRYPKTLYPSMEACGLWVSDVCRQSGLAYNYGAKTIAFTACILI